MTKLIILDRDGVINEDSPDFIKSPEEWRPLPGSVEAIAQLSARGYKIVVATNQSGIARGLYDQGMLEKIHAKMLATVNAAGGSIDHIFYCPHGPQDTCDCRKPLPGLFQQIAQFYAISLTGVQAVGDSWRDIQAAQAAGCQPVLVLTGNGKKTQQQHAQALVDVPCFEDLAHFAHSLI